MKPDLRSAAKLHNSLVALEGWRLRVLAFVLGALLALSFAPFGLIFLPFLILPLVILILDGQGGRYACFLFGWWFGFGHFLAGLFWVGHSFLAQSQVPAWAAPFAVVALCVGLAFFFAAAFVAYKSFAPTGWRRVVKFALIWVAIEWIRGHILTGLPWNLIANIWYVSEQMMQPAAHLGAYGLSFVTVFCAAGLVFFLAPGGAAQKAPALARYASPVLLVLLFASGALRLSDSELDFHDGVGLRIVQAAIPQKEKWVRENWAANFQRHVELSLGGENGAAISHVIWPETAIPYASIHEEPVRRFVLAGMLGNRMTLLAGAPRRQANEGEVQIFNSLHAIGVGGRLLATYDKAHLVPFGEYVPLRGLLSKIGLETMVPGTLDYSSGPGLRTLRVPGLPPFSPLICYEVIFPGEVVRRDDRAQWILNLTNDAWFGQTPGPHQHLAMARFRAVEEGLPIVRAASTGISAVIDPYGRILDKIALNRTGTLDSALPRPVQGLTLYARFGDWILFVMIVAMTGISFSLTKKRS